MVDALLRDISSDRLAKAAATLSERYRAKPPDRPFVRDRIDALAYLATRFPATYAVTSTVLDEIARVRPDWHPTTMLDVGAGPATATLAATQTWPSITQATLVEPDPHMREVGEQLCDGTWTTDVPSGRFDLVVASYVLGEVTDPIAAKLWGLTADTLVVVEPGTPVGFAVVRDVRTSLDGHTLAPCTHDQPCPITGDDWCHFSQRLPRSPTHRTAKRAERGYEDEPFSYVVLSRRARPPGGSRVVRAPRRRTGFVALRTCSDEGLHDRTISRRDGDTYLAVRRARWGDRLDGKLGTHDTGGNA